MPTSERVGVHRRAVSRDLIQGTAYAGKQVSACLHKYYSTAPRDTGRIAHARKCPVIGRKKNQSVATITRLRPVAADSRENGIERVRSSRRALSPIRQVPMPNTGISAPEGILQERIRNFRD